MRVIDADKLIEKFEEIEGREYTAIFINQIIKLIEQQPTLEGSNGDIVKSLLTITDEWTAYNFAEDCKEVNIKADGIIGVSSFKKSWWDAPYGR